MASAKCHAGRLLRQGLYTLACVRWIGRRWQQVVDGLSKPCKPGCVSAAADRVPPRGQILISCYCGLWLPPFRWLCGCQCAHFDQPLCWYISFALKPRQTSNTAVVEHLIYALLHNGTGLVYEGAEPQRPQFAATSECMHRSCGRALLLAAVHSGSALGMITEKGSELLTL